MPESQISTDEVNLNQHFEGYTVENKFLPGQKRARVSVLVSDNLEYERMHMIEDDWISTIWLKIKISRNQSLMLMCGYREWKYLKETGRQPGSDLPKEQMVRFRNILGQITNAASFSNKILLGWDANLDLSKENDMNSRYDVKQIAEEYMEFMNVNDFVLMNHEPTRHWSGCKSTLIDHFISNTPGHIDNIITKHSHIADHDWVSIMFHTDLIIDKPQFLMTRSWSELNKENLDKLIDNDPIINGIFNLTGVDKVWNILILQINSYINQLAPTRIIQIKKNSAPYMCEEADYRLNECDKALTEAIRTDEQEKWRVWRSLRNQTSRFIDQIKGDYFTRVLNNTNQIWKAIQLVTNEDNSSVPRRINWNGESLTSSKKIANVCIDFFKNKIEMIRQKFKESDIDPLQFLKFLI